MNNYLVPGLLGILASAHTIAVAANENTADGNNDNAAEEVVVTLSAGDKTADQLTQSALVLGEDALRRERQASLGDTLALQPGVASSGYGAAVSRPVIRGLGGSRIQVLDDGMAAVDASSISPDHAVAVHLHGASQIEVLRGPATLLYGSGAFGGVVNVVGADEDQPLPDGGLTEVDGQYQTVNNGKALGIRHENEQGDWRWHGSYNQSSSDEYRVPVDARDDEGNERLENSDIKSSQELAVGSRYRLDGGSWGVNFGWLRSDFGLPGHAHHDEEAADDAAEEEHHEESPARVALVQRRVQSELKLQAPTDWLDDLKWQLALTDYQHREGHAATDEEPASRTLFERDQAAMRLELGLAPVADWQHRVGMQWSQETFSASGAEALVPKTDTAASGLFWLGERQWQNWSLQLGARIDYQRLTPDGDQMLSASAASGACNFEPADGKSRDFADRSLSVGLLREFEDGWQVAGSLTSARHAPGAEELYSCGAHDSTLTFDVGNPDLVSEQATNLDLALRRNSGDWQGSVALYQNRIRNFIYRNALQDAGSWLMVEEFQGYGFAQDNVVMRGGEFQLGWQQTNSLQWQWMADRVRGEFADGGWLPRMPADRLGMGMSYENGLWNGFVQGYRVLPQTRLAAWGEDASGSRLSETRTDGYWLLNLGAGYYLVRPEAEYLLSLKLNNLLDQVIRNHASFVKDQVPQPGRNLTLGLTATF